MNEREQSTGESKVHCRWAPQIILMISDEFVISYCSINRAGSENNEESRLPSFSDTWHTPRVLLSIFGQEMFLEIGGKEQAVICRCQVKARIQIRFELASRLSLWLTSKSSPSGDRDNGLGTRCRKKLDYGESPYTNRPSIRMRILKDAKVKAPCPTETMAR